MICVSNAYVVALVLPVLSLFALALWLVAKFPAHGSAEEGVSPDEVDALSEGPFQKRCSDCGAPFLTHFYEEANLCIRCVAEGFRFTKEENDA